MSPLRPGRSRSPRLLRTKNWGKTRSVRCPRSNPNRAWCIFPNESDVVTLFGPKSFAGGAADGRQDLRDGSFSWAPAALGAAQPFVLTPHVVSTPRPGNMLPRADFTVTRLDGPGSRFALDSSASADPDGRIVAWTWYDGIPTFSTDPNPTLSLESGTSAEVTLTVTDDGGATGTVTKTVQAANRPPAIPGSGPAGGSVVEGIAAVDVVSTSSGAGYWQVADDGGVFSYGDARFHGSAPGLDLDVRDVVGAARTPDDGGYWLVDAHGGVFAFGNADFFGSMAETPMNAEVVGVAATPTGRGYWLVGADGGVFTFGDAEFYGSMADTALNGDVVAIASTPSGAGYWLAGADGGVFAFGDASFHGSLADEALNAPIEDLDATPDGTGYWLTAQDGGVFAFGGAAFLGSLADEPLDGRVVGMSALPTGDGYWLGGCDGGIFALGAADFLGARSDNQCRDS